AKSDAVWFRFLGLSSHRRDGGYLEGLIEFLQIIKQQMSQWPIDRLFLADDPLFKIKTALPPAENLRQSPFAFQCSIGGMPDLPAQSLGGGSAVGQRDLLLLSNAD